MKFKSDREASQLSETSVILRMIAFDLDFLCESFLGKEITVTRVYDPIDGESGVHLDKRAFDVRDEHDGMKLFSDDEIEHILSYMNRKWRRNDGLDTVIHHQFQGGPFHLHVQIPLSTKVYEPKT